MKQKKYVGRFAPSPTGYLHMGSLIAAIASYCEAQKNNGKWLIRIEDLDPPREVQGASQAIIKTMIKLGFEFDKNLIYQSQHDRQVAYERAIERLKPHLYYCSCSRTALKNTSIEQHQCRYQQKITSKPYSIKIKVPDHVISFDDKIQGNYTKNLLSDCGDFVIKRKEQLYSYQIAVVVDDDFQQVTDVVRGIDLIDSTPWQIYLYQLLNLKQPQYAHIPIIINDKNQKLSKQTYATAIDANDPIKTLSCALAYLNQPIPQATTLAKFWQQAIDNWDISQLSNMQNIQF